MNKALSIVAVLALTSVAAADVTTIDFNMGTLGAGSYSFSGTTLGASNDADVYANSGGTQSAVWGADRFYQFTTTATFTISLTSNDPNGGTDNDFFLLNSLTTSINGFGRNAATSIQSGLVEVNGTFGTFPAGTYYLSVDAWAGGDGSGLHAGDYAFTLNLVPTPGAAAMLGLGGLAALRRRR